MAAIYIHVSVIICTYRGHKNRETCRGESFNRNKQWVTYCTASMWEDTRHETKTWKQAMQWKKPVRTDKLIC